MRYKAIVIGASAGGMEAIKVILSMLPKSFSVPIFIVQHLLAGKQTKIEDYYKKYCSLRICEAESLMPIEKATVYFAPPDYHMLIEKNMTISLITDAKVNYSRPSIDVLFESAADCFTNSLIGIILTGASKDGSEGLLAIKNKGGLCIIQDPSTAHIDIMPKAALNRTNTETVLKLNEIADFLIKIC